MGAIGQHDSFTAKAFVCCSVLTGVFRAPTHRNLGQGYANECPRKSCSGRETGGGGFLVTGQKLQRVTPQGLLHKTPWLLTGHDPSRGPGLKVSKIRGISRFG